MPRVVTRLVGLLALVAAAAVTDAHVDDVSEVMARVGERVERYYARAQSVICEETVRMQPLGADLLWDGSHVRTLVSELRVSWEPAIEVGKAPEATVLRDLIKVDGRAPRPSDKPGCMDPKPVSPEPLAMLLPLQQREFIFTLSGQRKTRGVPVVMLDFKSTSAKPPTVSWKDECVSIELPGRWRGRVWAEAETGDVLRLDEQLVGIFDFPVPKEHAKRGGASSMVIERADSSITYRAVKFEDPEETVMLPESVVTLQVVRNSGTPRLRTYRTFSNYRRFITGARIVQDEGR